jgi:hypothetical protein
MTKGELLDKLSHVRDRAKILVATKDGDAVEVVGVDAIADEVFLLPSVPLEIADEPPPLAA